MKLLQIWKPYQKKQKNNRSQFNSKEMMQILKHWFKHPSVCFVDYQKAFNSVELRVIKK